MKLLFAYFDFTKQNNKPTSFHLDSDYGLNFSTKYNFSVIREETPPDTGKAIKYIIEQKYKPANECIPEGFWKERIYNITAIVGDNGSGKSTLLHNIIRATVYGLDPGVPFLLILQKTDSEKLFLYCSDRASFVWNGIGTLTPRSEYPKELKKTKCMLLDNTLSLSSYQLFNDYDDFISMEAWNDNDRESNSYQEWEKQFYDKSLFSSIQFGNIMSTDVEQTTSYSSASTVMFNHFAYESFQEVRFLFDEYYQETLNKLDQQGYPIPHPGHVFVSVTPADKLCDLSFVFDHPEEHKPWFNLFRSYEHQGFLGQIAINAMINLLSVFATHYPSVHIDEKMLGDLSNLEEKAFIENIEETARMFSEYTYVSFSSWVKFISYLDKEYKTLQIIFQDSTSAPTSINDAQYMIDVQEIISDPEKQECFILFLDAYKQICNPRYFLTFHSGMSSGEKNLLRMLTQFRYALRGPMYSGVVANKYTALMNCFRNSSSYCDTLFLFLDEVDLTYHPEWQRILIAMLNDVLPLIFHDPYITKRDPRGGCHDIQVILTTHSPLILGDFPKASVLYLKKPDNGEQLSPRSTFGENLYTILKNGFFMNDTIGAFAKSKINEIVKWCNDVREYCNKRDSDKEHKNCDLEQLLYNEFDKHFQTMQLLSHGVIQNKLILEMSECLKRLTNRNFEEKFDIARPDNSILLRGQIEELNAKLLRAERQIEELKKGH